LSQHIRPKNVVIYPITSITFDVSRPAPLYSHDRKDSVGSSTSFLTLDSSFFEWDDDKYDDGEDSFTAEAVAANPDDPYAGQDQQHQPTVPEFISEPESCLQQEISDSASNAYLAVPPSGEDQHDSSKKTARFVTPFADCKPMGPVTVPRDCESFCLMSIESSRSWKSQYLNTSAEIIEVSDNSHLSFNITSIDIVANLVSEDDSNKSQFSNSTMSIDEDENTKIPDSDIRETDVLMGQSYAFRKHLGTLWLAELIVDRYDNYNDKPKKKLKTQVSETIVEIIASKGGRFLKKSKKAIFWEEVDDKKAREKVASNFRDERNRRTEAAIQNS
jgi:hypothetical protein